MRWCWLLLLISAAAQADVVVRLSPHASLMGPELAEHWIDIAKLGAVKASPALQEEIRLVKISVTQKELQQKRLAKAMVSRQLQAWMKVRGIREPLQVTGPEWILLSGFSQSLAPSAVFTLAQDYLQKRLEGRFDQVSLNPAAALGDILLVSARPWSLVARWDDSAAITQRLCVFVDVFQQGAVVKTIPVWFKVSALANAWVLQQDAQAGQSADTVSVRHEQVDFAAQTAPPVGDDVDLAQKAFLLPAQAGQVLTQALLEDKPWVEKGAMVSVSVQSGKVHILAQAEAMQNGRRGDVVKLKSLSSQDEFWGTVVARGQVTAGGVRR